MWDKVWNDLSRWLVKGVGCEDEIWQIWRGCFGDLKDGIRRGSSRWIMAVGRWYSWINLGFKGRD